MSGDDAPVVRLDLRLERLQRGRYRLRLTSHTPQLYRDLFLGRLLEANASAAPRAAATTRDLGHPPAAPSTAPRLGALRRLGTELFGLLLKGEMLVAYRAARTRARAADVQLRIFSHIDAPELDALPWEALCDPEDGQFLIADGAISIVRLRDVAARVAPPDDDRVLHVTVAIAAPRRVDKLAVEREWRRIEQALAAPVDRGQVTLHRLPGGTLDDLLQHLDAQPCDVLHFIGHGRYARDDDRGDLLFESADGDIDPVADRRLATALRDCGVRLAVLNACDGARASRRGDVHAGLARSLIQLGIPTVVAMRARIADGAAADFAARLYARLAEGDAVVDAIDAVRLQLFRERSDATWSLPIVLAHPDAPLNASLVPPRRALPTAPVAALRARPWLARTLAAIAGLAIVGLALTAVGALDVRRAPAVEGTVTLERVDDAPDANPASAADDADRRVAWANPPACPAPPGVTLPMTLVPAGTVPLPMASTQAAGAALRARDALDRWPARGAARPFCLGLYEVTQAQWSALMPDRPHNSGWPGANRPVERIRRVDAEAFIAALNQRVEGNPFRLPTEREWAYAAAAGSANTYAFGDDPTALPQHGNCRSRTVDDGHDGTAPVGTFAPNAFGLYDLHGNVWEWTAADPRAPSAAPGVLRGGSYDVVPTRCTIDERKVLAADRRRKDYGFRVARDPVASPAATALAAP
ncbi:MAG: CHAT domain-containing protein [Acidobacteriota bacterium]